LCIIQAVANLSGMVVEVLRKILQGLLASKPNKVFETGDGEFVQELT
jgi:hypothetical protein